MEKFGSALLTHLLHREKLERCMYRYIFIQNELHIIRPDFRVEGDSQEKSPGVEVKCIRLWE